MTIQQLNNLAIQQFNNSTINNKIIPTLATAHYIGQTDFL